MEHAEGGTPGPVRAAIDGLSATAQMAHREIDTAAASIDLALRQITDGATSSVPRREAGAIESALRAVAAGMNDVVTQLDDEISAVIKTQTAELEALLRAGDETAPVGAATSEPPDEPPSEPPPLPSLDDIEAPKGTTEWAEAVVQRYPRLAVEEVLAIYHYTTVAGVQEMNRHLRTAEKTPEADRAAIQARIDAAVAGLKKLPKVQGVTFRGTYIPDDILPDWRVGARVSDPAFYSSSTDAAVAEDFRTRQNGNAYITITGTTGVDVQQLSYFGHEAEILFLPGTEWRVITAEWDAHRRCWNFDVVEVTR